MASKVMDKLKFFAGLEVEEEEEELVDLYKDMRRDNLEDEKTFTTDRYKPEMDIHEKAQESFDTIKASNKVFNIHSNSQMNVVIFDPKCFDDATIIVDTLRNQKPVILNISKLDDELGMKIFDFCLGALCALDGHIEQISNGIFVLAPENVEVSGDIKSSVEKISK